MRVISGSAGRLKLITPKTMDVRPTTDRIKETLFNIINPYLFDCEFLDACAGSGQIGIEALSRGGASAVFVENYGPSLDCIKSNLRTTKLEEKALVINCTAQLCVSRLYTLNRKFDIIFIDPPYNKKIEKEFLENLAKYNILKEDGFIIVEASVDTDFEYIDELGFEIYREKSYGTNKHIFIRKSGIKNE